MKSILLSCAAFLAMALTPVFAQELAIGEPAPMPDAPMVGVDGEKHTLNSLKQDNGLLVVYSCNTCPFVVGNGNKTEGWEGRYNGVAAFAAERQVGTVLVNSNEAKREGDDSFPAMRKHAKEAGYTMPYLMDEGSKLANNMGARTTPHIYLFDGDMNLVYRGSIDDNVNRAEDVEERYLENALERLATGKKIKVAETKAVGCSIKRVK